MKKTAVIIMIITLISKLFGFSRDMALSYYYGTSSITDAFLISDTIPSVIFGFIGVAITTAYLPVLSRVNSRDDNIEASKYTSIVINYFMIAITFVFIIGLIFTDKLVKVFAFGFSGETLSIAIVFTRISLVGMYFSTLISIFRSYLHVKGNFYVPALIGIPLNVVFVIFIILSAKVDQRLLAVGSVVALASQLIIMIPFVKKEKFSYKLVIDAKDQNVRKTFIVAVPAIVGASVNQINVLLDRTIASTVSMGGISALNYANRLIIFIEGIFITSLITVMYPALSNLASINDLTKLKKIITETLTIVNIIIVPIVFGTIIFSEEIVSLIYKRGAFNISALDMTSYSLLFYSISLIGIGIREVLSRVFYALQDTKTPMVNGAIGMSTNILLNIILSRFIGIAGIALATSLSAMLTAGLMIVNLNKKIGSFQLKRVSISFAKIVVASIIMSILAKMSFIAINSTLSNNASLILAIVVATISYTLIVSIMRIKEYDEISNSIFSKIKNKLGVL